MQYFNNYLFLWYALCGIVFYIFFYKLGATKLEAPMNQCTFKMKLFFLFIIIIIWPVLLIRVLTFKKKD